MTESGSQRPPDGFDSAVEVDPDLERIEAALLETERGRRFLVAHARRHRGADTQTLLQAIARIEAVVTQESPRPGGSDDASSLLAGLTALIDAVASLRAEIGEGADTPAPFAASARAAERTTGAILAAAEAMQEAAWTLREQGADARLCAVLDRGAAEIGAACASRDRTSRPGLRIAQTLDLLETRIAAMIEAADTTPRPHRAVLSPIPAEDEIAFAAVAATVASAAAVDEPVDELPQPGEASAEPGKLARDDLAMAFADLDGLSIEEKIALFS